jgi:hypothetical protein
MNARDEFFTHIEFWQILCATITHGDTWIDDAPTYNLKVGFTIDEFNEFTKSLDFEYSSGYGGQNLFGTIWYTDGTWSSRGEYDGSEWWEYNICPVIPKELVKHF